MLITSLLSSVLARYGIHHAQRKNWLPKNHYQHKALECLKSGDIVQAIEHNRTVRRKDPGYEEAQIVRELILMWFDNKIRPLEKKSAADLEKITALKNELNNLENSKRRVSLLLALPAAILVLLPPAAYALLRSRIDTGIIITMLAIYSFAVTAVVYFTVKKIAFDPGKSPFVRINDLKENTEHKIKIRERSLEKRTAEIDEYKILRDQFKDEINEPDTLLNTIRSNDVK